MQIVRVDYICAQVLHLKAIYREFVGRDHTQGLYKSVFRYRSLCRSPGYVVCPNQFSLVTLDNLDCRVSKHSSVLICFSY